MTNRIMVFGNFAKGPKKDEKDHKKPLQPLCRNLKPSDSTDSYATWEASSCLAGQDLTRLCVVRNFSVQKNPKRGNRNWMLGDQNE
jgi:hypothetical protein